MYFVPLAASVNRGAFQMLKALSHHLATLAITRDICWKSLGGDAQQAARYDEALQAFVLSLPDLLGQTGAWFASPDTPRELRQLYATLLTYVYHAVDVIPEEVFGFWGYLDDAYLVGRVYLETVGLHPEGSRRFDGAFDVRLGEWLALTRDVVPDHTRRLDTLAEHLVALDFAAFDAGLIAKEG
jgi:uncharacterized membrane protein YkvA (DUF1232 family)